ncbi:HAD superfamily hydrolase, 5'-nucleotidase, partial [Cooperia oncophora]
MKLLQACSGIGSAPRVNPRAVFANNELDLGTIDVYGFDYDYTLAVYTRHLNALIYKLALHRLISQFKYPENILYVPYDSEFAIRGLHFDVESSCLLKVDAFLQIQNGSVYKGKRRLADSEVKRLFPRLSLSNIDGRQVPQLVDFFSLPWAGLLSTVVHYCDLHHIVFDPKCLFDDLEECVKQVHTSGEMYRAVCDNLEHYMHRNEGLKEYLDLLHSNNKELFVVTNSPFPFINVGMTYMLGEDWRKYFKYIVVLAKKPTFFKGREPFRIYDPELEIMSFEKVHRLEEGQIYSGGNIEDLSIRAGFKNKGVLYFGDHIYTDLADPILRLGWRTAAVVPELAREIRVQNDDTYQEIIQWLAMLTAIIEVYRPDSLQDPDAASVIEEWQDERSRYRYDYYLWRAESYNMKVEHDPLNVYWA